MVKYARERITLINKYAYNTTIINTAYVNIDFQ